MLKFAYNFCFALLFVLTHSCVKAPSTEVVYGDEFTVSDYEKVLQTLELPELKLTNLSKGDKTTYRFFRSVNNMEPVTIEESTITLTDFYRIKEKITFTHLLDYSVIDSQYASGYQRGSSVFRTEVITSPDPSVSPPSSLPPTTTTLPPNEGGGTSPPTTNPTPAPTTTQPPQEEKDPVFTLHNLKTSLGRIGLNKNILESRDPVTNALNCANIPTCSCTVSSCTGYLNTIEISYDIVYRDDPAKPFKKSIRVIYARDLPYVFYHRWFDFPSRGAFDFSNVISYCEKFSIEVESQRVPIFQCREAIDYSYMIKTIPK
jgi:hypothetical protein